MFYNHHWYENIHILLTEKSDYKQYLPYGGIYIEMFLWLVRLFYYTGLCVFLPTFQNGLKFFINEHTNFIGKNPIKIYLGTG